MGTLSRRVTGGYRIYDCMKVTYTSFRLKDVGTEKHHQIAEAHLLRALDD